MYQEQKVLQFTSMRFAARAKAKAANHTSKEVQISFDCFFYDHFKNSKLDPLLLEIIYRHA